MPASTASVVDLDGNAAGAYSVRYVPQVTFDGSDDPVPLRGGAFPDVLVRARTPGARIRWLTRRPCL